MNYNIGFLFLLCFTLILSHFTQIYGSLVTIEVGELGSVIGNQTLAINGVPFNSFLGVPFANPPIGNLRFRPPSAVSPWEGSGPLSALSFPNFCLQPDYNVTKPIGDEDCLYLNVWSPSVPNKNSSNGLYPIMFYIYGGGFNDFVYQQGDTFLYNSPNTVIIMAHYRVNLFGFLAHPELSKENDNSSGNYGLMDQAFALSFVNKYGKYFNGDPNRVTIMGESAGSISVCAHLVSPLSKGLFSAAIMQSGGCDNPSSSLASGESIGVKFFDYLNCSTVDCIRSIPGEDLLKALISFNSVCTFCDTAIHPILDNYFFKNIQPYHSFINGNAASVPLLVGSTNAEFGYFIGLSSSLQNSSWTDVYNNLGSGKNVSEIVEYYSESNNIWNNNPVEALNQALSAQDFQCPNKRTAGYITDIYKNKAWVYTWSYYNKTKSYWSSYGAVHSSELPFVFGTPNNNVDAGRITGSSFSDLEKKISNTLQQYWLRFVHNHDPNIVDNVSIDNTIDNIVEWIQYDTSFENYLEFTYEGTVKVNQLYHQTQCQLWQKTIV